ncbi:recombination-associated protein RdgC [Rhodoferax sp.]|uniref:recombination-associated protein RdgC n=1 Tax=Rhodoferax sp. TaxID=50421 RepID=UPI002743B361|nr:recombination-associated protein RdgC [Rhodoferax sp.]
MFKNVIVYRLGSDWSATVAQMEASLDSARFVECGPSQERSVGWIEPRGEAHGPLVEAVGGQWILKLMIEVKAVPSSVLNRKVKDQVDHIEATTGRKPGKKEKRDIKEDFKLSLLPMAFSKQAAVTVWIDPGAHLLVLDAGSQSKADEVLSALVKSIDGFAPTLVNTVTSPAVAMSEWLVSQEPPAGLSVDRECELKATDESKAVVRYARHPLDNDEVVAHVRGGKQASKLALTWDSRVSFMLTESLQIKKIAFLDVVMDGVSDRKNEGFDADVALATGELRRLIPDLLAALGGEMKIS